jgi:hypothetical protein
MMQKVRQKEKVGNLFLTFKAPEFVFLIPADVK